MTIDSEALKILEAVSYIANVILVIVACFGLWQLKIALAQLELTKTDIELRSRREAGSLSAAQCEKFANEVIPKADALNQFLQVKGLMKSWVPAETFTVDNYSEFEPWFKVWRDDVKFRCDMMTALNLMESVAIYFDKNLADEALAFPSLAVSYCANCEFFYPFIVNYRVKGKHPLYQSTVALYQLWSARLKKNSLDHQIQDLGQQRSQLGKTENIMPLGAKVRGVT